MILEIFGKTLKIKIGERPVLIYNENVPQNDTGNLRENTKNRKMCLFTTKIFRKMILGIFGKILKVKIGERPVLIYNENVPRK